MRNLFLSVIALGTLSGGTLIGAGAASAAPASAALPHDPAVQAVQYYEPGWQEREEWHRRREIEHLRREEWRRRQEAREFYRQQPLPYYGYGPRY